MRRAAVALLAATVSLTATLAWAAQHDTVLIVPATGTGGLGIGADAGGASLSADARYVAFGSDSPRLHRDDRDSIYDVFVYDRRTRRTTLVSRASGAKGVKGDEGSGGPQISADGRLVVFDGARDIDPTLPEDYSFSPKYLRDLRTNRMVIVSRASGARGRFANNASYNARISADGRFVVYDAEATNLHPDDRTDRPDVYARDLRTNRTILVSRASGARGRHGNSVSEKPSVSADGRYVAFESRSSNLVPADREKGRDVFVRDLVKHRTVLVNPGAGVASSPSISPDGRFVAFTYHRGADIDAADTDRLRDVYLKDLVTGRVELVSRGGNSSDVASVSEDARRIVFESTARDLDPADTDSQTDVYVYDRASATTTLVSRASGAGGAKAAGPERLYSGGAAITSDGRWVAFDSNATNLDPGDTDEGTDMFIRDLGPPPPAPGYSLFP